MARAPLSAPTAPLPGIADVAALVDRFRMAVLQVQASDMTDTRLRTADASLQLAVYRIVQESLTNALRYAPGTGAVELVVRSRPDSLEIVVTDHGPTVPIDPGHGSRRGLIGMRERAAAFGGSVESGPHGDGWRVRAVLPRQEEEAA